MWKRRFLAVVGWVLTLLGVVWTVAPTPFGVVVIAAGLGLVCVNSLASRRRLKRLVLRYPFLRKPLSRLPGVAGYIWLVGKERHLARAERRRLKALAKAREKAVRHNGVKP